MFLNKLIRRARSEERGSAMIAVVGVMAVGLLLTAMVMTSVVSGFGFTTATRAGVQSQAAADGGIAIARAGLESGTCAANSGVYQSVPGAVPRYRVEVWRPRTNGTGWDRGCPTSTGTPVRLVSMGTAVAPGVGVSGKNTRYVEAVLAQPSTSSIAPSGPAIYAYRSTGFGNSGRLEQVNGSRPSVLVKNGDVACTGASAAPADWVVDAGTLTLGNDCQINGNVWSNGRAAFSGRASASGTVVAPGITLQNSGTIGGSAWSTLDITMSGSAEIWGNATASSLSMSNSAKISKDAWINGAAQLAGASTIAGHLTAKTKSGSGAVGQGTTSTASPGAGPFIPPARPIVPTWTDYAYRSADWPGFREVVLGSDCSASAISSAVNSFGSAPGIVDARSCGPGITLAGDVNVATRNDVVLVANKFSLGGGAKFTSVNNHEHRLWLITPDTVDNDEPTCPTGGSYTADGNFTFSVHLSVMVYSPCAVNNNNSVSFRGQIYSGSTTINNGTTIGYVPVGLPNANLDTGAATAPNPAGSPWLPISIRNLANG